MNREHDLLREAQPVVERFARRAWHRLGRRIPLDDLIAVGRAGALDAVRRFDAHRSHFLPYITLRIRWTFMSEIRRVARRSRCEQRILASLFSPPSADPQKALTRKQIRSALAAAIDALGEPSRTIVKRHYFAEQRIDRTATELGISFHTAHRLHNRALRDLRRRLKDLDALDDTLPSEEG